jgi:hypothetical protein
LQERAKPTQAPGFPGVSLPLAERITPQRVDYPGAEVPHNLAKARTGAVNFVGREDAMTQLHHQLQQQERIAITALSNENIVLKPAKECFRQGWQDAMTGNIQPISELWEGIDAE